MIVYDLRYPLDIIGNRIAQSRKEHKVLWLSLRLCVKNSLNHKIARIRQIIYGSLVLGSVGSTPNNFTGDEWR